MSLQWVWHLGVVGWLYATEGRFGIKDYFRFQCRKMVGWGRWDIGRKMGGYASSSGCRHCLPGNWSFRRESTLLYL